MATDSLTYPFSDLALARRLERAEGYSNARFVEARADISPDRGACWIEVAGVFAMFDGPASPVSQTFGLGMAGMPAPDDLSTIEAFFTGRGAPVHHEVSPMADAALLTLLSERGYRPIELTSVLYRPLGGLPRAEGAGGALAVRQAGEADHELWARTAAEGWSEFPAAAEFMLEMCRVSARRADALLFLAEVDGTPVATAALSVCDGVALLAGASTVPSGRKQGAQLALLDARLRHAAAMGCDVAMMGALPGSGSQRNAERNGFRIAYTRTKWVLTPPSHRDELS